MDAIIKFFNEYYKKYGTNFIVVAFLAFILLIYSLIIIVSPHTGKKIFYYVRYSTYDTFHTSSKYFFETGVFYNEQGLYNLASNTFKRALHIKGDVFNLNPQDLYQLESLYNLGVIHYMYLKQYSKAVYYFNKYLEIFPKNLKNPHKEDIYKVVNFILSMDDKTKNAQAKSMKSVGNDFYFKKDYDKAIEYYLKALALDPSYVEVYNNLAAVYLQMNDFENAVKYWKITLMFSPDELDLYINTALALEEKLKKYKEAIYYYEGFLENAPKNDARRPIVEQKIKTLETMVKGNKI